MVARPDDLSAAQASGYYLKKRTAIPPIKHQRCSVLLVQKRKNQTFLSPRALQCSSGALKPSLKRCAACLANWIELD